MILLYSTTVEAEKQILTRLHQLDIKPVKIAATERQLVELARHHRPDLVLMFMPLAAGAAVEIQYFLREILTHTRVRILPSVLGTKELNAAWEKVVTQALQSPRVEHGNKETQ